MRRSRALEIRLAHFESFCVGRTALVAAVLRTGAHHVSEVDVVVLAHPVELRVVALEHLDLEVNLDRDVNEFVGDKVYAREGVHVVARDELRRPLP